jgi:phasin family protein
MTQNFVNQDVVNSFTQQFEPVVGAVQEFNKLSLNHLEKVVNLELSNLRAYTDLGLANLRAGAEVRNVENFKNYTARQGELAQTLGNKLVEDTKTLAELNAQFNVDALKLVQEQAGKFSKQAV